MFSIETLVSFVPFFPYAGAIRWHLPYIRWSNMVKILHTERCCTFEAWNVVREWLAERADRKWFTRSPDIVEFNEKTAENEVKNQYTDNYELEWYLRVEKSPNTHRRNVEMTRSLLKYLNASNANCIVPFFLLSLSLSLLNASVAKHFIRFISIWEQLSHIYSH